MKENMITCKDAVTVPMNEMPMKSMYMFLDTVYTSTPATPSFNFGSETIADWFHPTFKLDALLLLTKSCSS